MNLDNFQQFMYINTELFFYTLAILSAFSLLLLIKVCEKKQGNINIYIVVSMIIFCITMYFLSSINSNFIYSQCKKVSIEKELCFFNFYYDDDQEKYTLLIGKKYYGYDKTLVDINGNPLKRRNDLYFYRIKVGEFNYKKSFFINLTSSEETKVKFNKIWNKENQEKVKNLIDTKDKEFANLMDNNHVD